MWAFDYGTDLSVAMSLTPSGTELLVGSRYQAPNITVPGPPPVTTVPPSITLFGKFAVADGSQIGSFSTNNTRSYRFISVLADVALLTHDHGFLQIINITDLTLIEDMYLVNSLV